MKLILIFTVLFQVALCAPPSVPFFEVQDFYGRTIDIETPVKEIVRVSVQASDNLLKLLDAKIELILCKVLKVCKDATTPQGRFALDELRLDEINDAILYNDVEDPAQGRLLHLLLNEDYQTYLTDRIQKTLCSYGSKQFCEVKPAVDPLAAVVDAAVDPLAAVADAVVDPLAAVVDAANARFYFRAPKKGQATPTLSLAIRKLFSRLAVKVGFVACKLSVWCPDEAKAFPVPVEIAAPVEEPAAPVEEPAAPVTTGARTQVVVGKFVG